MVTLKVHVGKFPTRSVMEEECGKFKDTKNHVHRMYNIHMQQIFAFVIYTTLEGVAETVLQRKNIFF